MLGYITSELGEHHAVTRSDSPPATEGSLAAGSDPPPPKEKEKHHRHRRKNTPQKDKKEKREKKPPVQTLENLFPPQLTPAIPVTSFPHTLGDSLDTVGEERWGDLLPIGVEVVLQGVVLFGVWGVVGCVVGLRLAVRSVGQ